MNEENPEQQPNEPKPDVPVTPTRVVRTRGGFRTGAGRPALDPRERRIIEKARAKGRAALPLVVELWMKIALGEVPARMRDRLHAARELADRCGLPPLAQIEAEVTGAIQPGRRLTGDQMRQVLEEFRRRLPGQIEALAARQDPEESRKRDRWSLEVALGLNTTEEYADPSPISDEELNGALRAIGFDRPYTEVGVAEVFRVMLHRERERVSTGKLLTKEEYHALMESRGRNVSDPIPARREGGAE